MAPYPDRRVGPRSKLAFRAWRNRSASSSLPRQVCFCALPVPATTPLNQLSAPLQVSAGMDIGRETRVSEETFVHWGKSRQPLCQRMNAGPKECNDGCRGSLKRWRLELG